MFLLQYKKRLFSYFKSEFTVIDWYIYWHLHHYRHGKFTGTVWKYWILRLKNTRNWTKVSARNPFGYTTGFWALLFTTWPRDTQTPHQFQWMMTNTIFQPDDFKIYVIFKISHLREANRLNPPFQNSHRRSDSQGHIHCECRHAARHQKVKQPPWAVSNGQESLDFPVSALNCTWSDLSATDIKIRIKSAKEQKWLFTVSELQNSWHPDTPMAQPSVTTQSKHILKVILGTLQGSHRCS